MSAITIETQTHSEFDMKHRRADLLADRIEEGADGLATFAEELSEVEWHTPVSGTDSRSIGVIVSDSIFCAMAAQDSNP